MLLKCETPIILKEAMLPSAAVQSTYSAVHSFVSAAVLRTRYCDDLPILVRKDWLKHFFQIYFDPLNAK